MNASPSALRPASVPPASRHSIRPAAKARPGGSSRAAWLVLLTGDAGVRALLFNAEFRYLAQVIDDPLTVDRLSSAGRACELPASLDLDGAMSSASGAAMDLRGVAVHCFALGSH